MPKIELTKYVYKFTEVGELLMAAYPGHYLNLKSANATVNTHARALGIKDHNGKKHNRWMGVSDVRRVLESISRTKMRTTATPIERAIKDADETPKPSEAPVEPVKAPAESVVEKLTAVEKKAEADAFELRRKNFYTDVNYFIKFAQSPEERLAIWDAIAKLYGLARGT